VDYPLDDTHKKYIKIIVTGPLEKNRIIHAMKALMTHPEFKIKHSFWNLKGASQGGIDILDIREIVGVLRLYRPKEKDFANKSAFLVSGGVNKSLINIYITMANLLPFKYRVFTDQDEARRFLTGNKPE